MLWFPLIHPPLLAALVACGHGGKVLIADANYSHSTNAHPRAALMIRRRGTTDHDREQFWALFAPNRSRS